MITCVSVSCKLFSQFHKNTNTPKICNYDWLLPCLNCHLYPLAGAFQCKNVFMTEMQHP